MGCTQRKCRSKPWLLESCAVRVRAVCPERSCSLSATGRVFARLLWQSRNLTRGTECQGSRKPIGLPSLWKNWWRSVDSGQYNTAELKERKNRGNFSTGHVHPVSGRRQEQEKGKVDAFGWRRHTTCSGSWAKVQKRAPPPRRWRGMLCFMTGRMFQFAVLKGRQRVLRDIPLLGGGA